MSDQAPMPGLGRQDKADEMPECSLPGVPLASGFEPVHGGLRRRVELSKEARARIEAKQRSVDEARRRAMEGASSYVIG